MSNLFAHAGFDSLTITHSLTPLEILILSALVYQNESGFLTGLTLSTGRLTVVALFHVFCLLSSVLYRPHGIGDEGASVISPQYSWG